MEFDVAELVNQIDVFELACKTNHKVGLTKEETEAAAQIDAHFKELGKMGHDADHEIAAFITTVINEEIDNTPNELLDSMFDRGSIGENDDYESIVLPPKNTLVAYDAAKGGNVERSFLDIAELKPTWASKQIETDISFADLSRNGWKSVSLITEYALAAFNNTLYKDMFDKIDAAIAPGADNYIAVASTMPTEVAMQQAALYIQDRADVNEGAFVGRSKYIQAISHFPTYISQDMMNELHLRGRLGTYEGISLYPVSSAKKLGDGSGLILDKRIFGIAGKIGTITMKGDIKTYQTEDVNKEVFHLLFKNFEYGYAFNKSTLDKVVKVVLQ